MYTVSARTLAEFTHPGGSIQTQSRVRKLEREGIRIHKQVQETRPPGYQVEVPLELNYDAGDIRLLVRGRIDGLFSGGLSATAVTDMGACATVPDQIPIIEEIKSTISQPGDLSPKDVHLAQAKLYAAMYAKITGTEQVRVHLTYIHFASGAERIFAYLFEAGELEAYFRTIVGGYVDHLRQLMQWEEERNGSIIATPFPFPQPRAGQQEFMEAVTDVIGNEEKLFVRAPTGIGKTVAAIFPALQSMARGVCSRIFYLSARTTAQANAEACLQRIRVAGGLLRSVTITAKAKICFLSLEICEPAGCPFADGYYGRLPDALDEVHNDGGAAYTREVIEALAKKHSLCPYELSLDIALISDVIICDYNYVFDPTVYLRRFFLEGDPGGIVLLIDEAHNLVDRAMEMFSAGIRKKLVLQAVRGVDASGNPALVKSLKSLNTYFIALRKTMKEEGRNFWVADEIDNDLAEKVEEALELFGEYFSGLAGEAIPQEVSDLYRNLFRFSLIRGIAGPGHRSYAENRSSDVLATIRCIDPSGMLREKTDACWAAVFFSATLTPFDYFTSLLDGGEDVQTLSLQSPFPKENLEVFIDPRFSTRYRDREQSLDPLAEYVEAFSGRGNCIFFFPSYEYLEMVLAAVTAQKPNLEILAQRRGMDDLGRKDFLESFVADHPEGVLAFAVLGGVFGEGIDLVGERLVAVVIVGVGMPPISDEKNLMKEYYDEKFGKGFLFAYTYPGMNRVLQAAGRVIRSGTDKGTVLFAGQRFATNGYRRLLTPEYAHAVVVDEVNRVIAPTLKEGSQPESNGERPGE